MNNFIKLLLSIFGINKNNTNDQERSNNKDYATEYRDISKTINVTAVFSQRLAALSTMDSTISIPGDNKRAELLNKIALSVWNKRKKLVSLALGYGGCVIVPYVQKRNLYYKFVTQDRININHMDGDKIVSALVVADKTTVKENRYYRILMYDIIDNNLVISYKTVDISGKETMIEEWENIPDIVIGNVDRVPFGFVKCPADNRESEDKYGVPITYGTNKIVVEILECLTDIRKEYKRKKTKLQVDERVFNRDEKGNPVIQDDIFIIGQSEDGNMFNIFDPAIRDSSYYNRLKNLFELLEKSVGTSKGIFTEPTATYENVEAIRAAVRDTWALISDIRDNLARAMEDFLHACDVFANYYNLTPGGKYSVTFDWDYSMIEKVSDTWAQLKEGQSIGARSKAEVRAWQTGENIEEAEKTVEQISKKEPNMQTLLGMSE